MFSLKKFNKQTDMVELGNGMNENGKMKDIFTKEFYKFLVKLHTYLQLEFSQKHDSLQFGTHAFEFGIDGKCNPAIYKIIYQGDTDKHVVHPLVINYLKWRNYEITTSNNKEISDNMGNSEQETIRLILIS